MSTGAQYNFDHVSQRPPPSSYMRAQNPGTKGGRIPTAVRVGPGQDRPVTSTRGAGFPASSHGRTPGGPQVPGTAGSQGGSLKPPQETPEIMFRRLEKELNTLLDKSAEAKLEGNFTSGLAFAKEAVSKEKRLRNLKEDAGMSEQINIDLTYAACVNLGIQYQANGMHQDALSTYSLVVRNRDYPHSGRLRVNMGNIYFSQEKYQNAIKMYRMALDQIQNIGKHMKFQIMRNIAIACVKMGKYPDAVENFEGIMQGEPDHPVAFNLLLCYYAQGDIEKMKKTFTMLLMIEIPGSQQDEMDGLEQKGPFGNDPLSEYIKQKRREAFKYIIEAGKLIAPIIQNDWIAGYAWVQQTLRASDYAVLQSEIGIFKAEQFIKLKDYEKAIEVFKSFQKKDQTLMARAATNISFLYFIQRDFRNADLYADLAIKNDRYNAKALVNKGNCLYVREDYEGSKQYYLQAIGVQADCVEAIYNLGLVNRRMDIDLQALQAFQKLQTIMANAPQVMYQIASIYENARNFKQAIKWYNILLTNLSSDPGILHRIGRLYSQLGDQNQAFHYYTESYRNYPVDIDVISWLGIFYVKSELFEKACTYFQRASQVHPNNPRWKIMVATCYRRMGMEQKAIDLYQNIHQQFPENIECLQCMVTVLKGTGQNYEHYSNLLSKLLREEEMQKQTPDHDYQTPQSTYQPNIQPQQVREEKPVEVQQRPGTSRMKRVMQNQKPQDEEEWAANQELMLP